MRGIKHALKTAIHYELNADIYRRIAIERTEEHLKTLDSKVDKLNFVHKVFEEFESGKEVSISYNLRRKIEKGEV